MLILQYYSQLYIEPVLTFSIEKYLVIMVSRGKDSAHSHPFSIVRVPEVSFITEHFPLYDFYILFILTEVKQSGDLPSIASTLLSGGPHHLHLL